MKSYLASVNKIEFDNLSLELKDYAKEHDVPIIQDEGLAFLRQIIKLFRPKRILEIGTAIGFSAINMALASDAIVDTIEISEESYLIALENVKRAHLEDRINIILDDALLIDLKKLANYDFIFIDAAKAQYKKFFLKFANLLTEKGIIVTDNLLFHGLVLEENIESKNLRRLVEKIKDYNLWLIENKEFDTHIYDIGDGMSISIKK